MPQLLNALVSSRGFMPHGHCYLWNPGLVWLHVVSDGLIALAYTSIPFTLAYFVRQRRDIPFNWMFSLFALFIVACGATHYMEIWTLWTPTYWLSGMIKAVTALASVPTAILLMRLVPQAVALPTAAQLSQAHAELSIAHDVLERRVTERTAELTAKNEELAQTAAALRASEVRFRRLSESGMMGIVLADESGKIFEANDAFLQMIGYTREDLRAGTINRATITPPEWIETALRARAQLAERGVTQPWEQEFFRKDGSRVPMLLSITMLEGPNVIVAALDLTEQKRAQAAIARLHQEREADAKFRALLQAAPDAMVITDQDDRIALVNAQTEQVFGYPRSELLGQRLTLLVPDVEPRLSAAAVAPVLLAASEHMAVRKSGDKFAVEISSSPIRTPDGKLVSHAIRDITERKRTEEELRRAKDVAETSSRELEAFSYSVAHDLRAPLRGINGLSVALLEDYTDKLDAEGNDYLTRIGAAAGHMGKLIDALLDLSRVSRVELVRETVSISELARASFKQLHANDTERAVDVSIANDLKAHADPQLLRALLDNLLGNALKFTSKRERPRIEVGLTEHAGSSVYFVRDNGAGFDMTYASKLFAPFRRLHSANDFAGTGIGLATVQRIVRRHGGRVWAEGAVEQGATFYFTLQAS